MQYSSKLLRLTIGLASCAVLLMSLACKKKTTRRATIIKPSGGTPSGSAGQGSDACAYSLSQVPMQPLDPMELKVTDIKITALDDTHMVSISERGTPFPVSHRIAYEVCPQEAIASCQEFSMLSNTQINNPMLKPGTAKVRAWACCNESDGLCKPNTPGYVEKKLGPKGSEKRYLCGQASLAGEGGFINIPALTTSLNLTGDSDKQQANYLYTITNQIERAATEAFGIIKKKNENDSNSETKIFYQALVNDGFDSFLRNIDAIGLDLAEGIVTSRVPDGISQTKQSSLNLTNNEDCITTFNDPVYTPIDNPYVDDPPSETPPEDPGKEQPPEQEDPDKKDGEEVALKEDAGLKALCEERGRQYQENQAGETEWNSESGECFLITNGERQSIDPTQDPVFSPSQSPVKDGEKGANGWQTFGGLLIGLGAVTAAGGTALYIDGNAPIGKASDKIAADLESVTKDIAALEETPESDRDMGKYKKLQLRQGELLLDRDILKYQNLLDDFEGLLQPGNDVQSQDLDAFKDEHGLKNGNDMLDNNAAKARLQERMDTLENLRNNKILDLTEDKLTELFSGSSLLTEDDLKPIAELENIKEGDPKFKDKMKSAWESFKNRSGSEAKMKAGKRTARFGIGTLVTGILAQQLFSLAQSPMDKRLLDIERYLVKALLKRQACQNDKSKCR